MNRERAFAIIVRFFAVGITAAAIVIAAGIVWLALSAQNRPKELTLVAVLLITAGTVIIASLVATFAHKAVYPRADGRENAAVFRESVRRFAWLASPIAASYGISQVAIDIAKVVTGTPQ